MNEEPVKNRIAVEFLNEIADRLQVKNVYYAGGEHPHFNFHIGASLLGYPQEQSWKVAFAYASKHLAKVVKWVRESENPKLEDAKEVFGDVIAYFALMLEILDEAEGGEKGGMDQSI